MKRLLLLALAVTFAACSPDIPTGANQSNNFVVAEFDPANSVIPLPNDLVALDPATGRPDLDPNGRIARLHAPETGGTDAQNEFNRDYLNHLDGFPLESSASVLFSQPIDVTTVVPFNGTNQTAATLAVFDVVHGAPVSNLTFSVSDAPNGGQTLSFIPTSGAWPRNGQFAVLLLGGANGIKGKSSGQTVTGSPTFAFVMSSTPLITCDANGNNCIPATLAIPTTAKDPGAQHDQRVALAKQLEQLRISYKPILDGAVAQIPGLKRTDIALVWTFTITSQAEVTFDPASLIIPFPNDVLNPTGSQVSIPAGSGLPPALVAGLNTLDGFSTTAPIVSENGVDTGPLVGRDSAGIQARVDSASVKFGSTGTVNLVVGGAGGGALPTTLDGSILAHACLNCPGIVMTQPDGGPVLLPDGGLKPDTLAIVPDVPLTERTLHAAYITTDLKDTSQKNVIASPAFALVRSSTPLYAGGHTTVSLLTDAQAQQLEPLRAGLKPLFDSLNTAGLPRTKLALGWAFTTQSTITALSKLHGAPLAAPAQTGFPLWVQEIPAPAGAPNPSGVVGHWFVGQILDLFALTGTSGTINPDTTKWTAPKIAFVMSVPAAGAPPTGYPVTLFGHGLTRDRTDAFGMSASLAAAGNVMVAIDEAWHGDRNTCTGFGALLAAGGAPPAAAQDLFACVNPNPAAPTQICNPAGHCELANRGDSSLLACDPTAIDADKVCMLGGQGHCAPDSKCEGGAFATSFSGVPIAGWNLINLQNFFATRDNFRQQVISNAQLARVASNTATGNLGQQAGGITLDGTKISYAGQSLGGIMGSLYSASAPEVRNAALNVPGGGLTNIILTSPAFVQLRDAFLGGLEAQGVEINSPLYDTFLGIVQWIIDPADPLNAGPYLVRDSRTGPFDPVNHPLANNGSTRRGFIQWIADDQVVPNPTTVDLIQSVLADPTADGVSVTPSTNVPRFWAKQFPSSGTPANNHGFLLGTAGAATAQQAQGQIANFIAGGAPF
jgi:hypothetical protein